MSPDADPSITTDQEPHPVSYDQFLQTSRIFADDLNIVNRPDLAPHNIFTPPLETNTHDPHHPYHLTLPDPNRSETETQALMSHIKVVLVGCMDWRVAKALYDKALQKGYQPNEILTFTFAGGMAPMNQERANALSTMITYAQENCPKLKEVIATVHDLRCGAMAEVTGAPPEQLAPCVGTELGGPAEKATMANFLSTGVNLDIPSHLKDRVKITAGILHPHMDESGQVQQVEFIPITIDPQAPKIRPWTLQKG